MKTITRVLMIMMVFSIVAGLIITIVNASGMNVHALDDTGQFRPQGSGNGGELRPPNFGNRPAERSEREGGGASRLIVGMIQNVVVIGLLVTAIVWPKSIAKKKKRTSAVSTSNNKS